MSESGAVVVEQAHDNSMLNTEPAVLRGVVIALVGAVATVLVVSGVLTAEQKQILEENAGAIAVAVITIIPILQGIWTRFSAYSPRSAARIAVVNSQQPHGAPPVLVSPP